MHQIIRVIVWGENGEEALNNAKEVLEDLCGDCKAFDYYTTFDDETSTVSGAARWGKRPVVALADSKEGKKLINEGMRFTKDGFMENVGRVRKALEIYSDEELFEEKNMKHKIPEKVSASLDCGDDSKEFDLRMFKYYCYSAGRYTGSDIFLYDGDGEGIRDGGHLKAVFNNWGKPTTDTKCWVVPADVHS